MLVGILLMTALLVSDVAGTVNSSEVEETLRAIEELTRGPCENGWFVYQPTRSCYRYFANPKTWKDAELFCNIQDHYGQLASVISCEHNEFISRVVKRVTGGAQSVWIGFKDFCKNGNFLWSDESSVRFMNWAVVNPRERNNAHHCTYVNTGSHGWHDYNCNNRLYYVCAYKYH
ncbi:regenerating islet-derived protein 4-like [Hypanus sabinus]|uniref:regenerating islet-derived protein 4-like n=1 Tax=Hypanus sabinus TaxID=79690 RepID=UPI0028C3F80D|nr:regenerating islet-derived protein 4-like [Hypanus sabinus]